MALARHPIPEVTTESFSWSKHRLLLIVAAAIATVCAGAAFVLLVLRDHGHPKVMVNEQAAPGISTRSAPAARAAETTKPVDTGKALLAIASPIAKTADATTAAKPEDQNKFNFARSNRRVTLGPLKLRLTNTDPLKNTYDVSVLTGRRSSLHRSVKVNEPLWIALNRGTGAIELVVTSIDANRVIGYWTESNHSPQVSARVRGRHR